VDLLFSYLRKYRGLIFLALALAATNQVFSLLDPLIFRHVIDDYATRFREYETHQFIKGAGTLLLMAMGVAFVSRVAKNFQDYYVNVIVQRVGAEMYSDGIRHSLELPYSVFEDQRSGETLGKLQKVRSDVEKFISLSINLIFTTLVGVVFVIIYALSVHWIIVPAFLATVPLLGTLSWMLSGRVKTIQKVIVAETTALAGSTTESLRNIELVKSLGLADQEVVRLNATTEKILKLELKKVKYIRSLSFGPMQELGNIINVYRETEVSLANFRKILETPKDPRPRAPVPISDIRTLEFDNVGFMHQSASMPALTDISFSMERGETIAFVGPSGAGKTTLVKLLVGLYQPKAGEVLYNGVSSTEVDLEHLREQIGLVTQDAQLFSGTIRENLKFVNPHATDEECLDVLHKAAAHTLLARADKGLDTLIGEGGVKVSGGEKQRLSIARALLRKPHLLVFDEATSSLDSLTEEEISRTMRDVANSREVITILIAHRLSTVMHADRIYVLERGKVVEAGQHQDLLDRTGLYYAMWRQQVGERRTTPHLPAGKPGQLAPV